MGDSYDVVRNAQKEKADKRKEQVRAWRKAGLTYEQIATLLGVSRQRAHQMGKERGGKPRKG